MYRDMSEEFFETVRTSTFMRFISDSRRPNPRNSTQTMREGANAAQNSGNGAAGASAALKCRSDAGCSMTRIAGSLVRTAEISAPMAPT